MKTPAIEGYPEHRAALVDALAAALLGGGGRIRLFRKAAIRSLETSFRETLKRIDAENRAYLQSRLSRREQTSAIELIDVDEEIEEAVAAFTEAIGKLDVEEEPLAVSKVSDRLAGIFAALINERRQLELGVTEYVWRTRGDDKVREDHQPRDAQVFDWDHRHHDGHPGHAPNCRCIAEPVLPDVSDEPYVPKTGLALEVVDVSAGTEGMLEAGRDLLGAAFDGLIDLPGNLFEALSDAARLVFLAAKEKAGTIDDNERAELAGLRRALDDRLQGSLDALGETPELAVAFGEYVLAVRQKVRSTSEAYARAEATEAELRAILKEEAYLDTTLIAPIVSGGVVARLLQRVGRADNLTGIREIVDALAARTRSLRRAPTDRGWPTISNPGIVWGRGIQQQGIPWEDHLEREGRTGIRLSGNFKTFDFFDLVTGIATSAKTVDLAAKTYQRNPAALYNRLNSAVRAILAFSYDQKDGISISNNRIKTRVVEVAVPIESTPEQDMHLQRAIEYAAARGVVLRITRIAQ